MRVSNFKLGIGIPLSFHMVPSAFFESFICMEKPDFIYIKPNPGDSEDPEQMRVDAMRNDVIAQALALGCSHLLMMDTDQIYPSDALVRLLSHNLPIVGARVRRRYPPFDNLLFRGTLGKYAPVPEEECLSGRVIEVDATGTGCLLFQMEVFRKLSAPWFYVRRHEWKPVSEDFRFCYNARRAGIPIHVDTGVYLPHLSQFGITDGFSDIYGKVSRILRQNSTKEVESDGIQSRQ